MDYFLGKYTCQIDEKGRLSLPVRLRRTLGQENHSRLFLVKGSEPGSLLLYTPREYEALAQRLKEQRDTAGKAHSRNYLFTNSSEVQLDRQGRIAIPSSLMPSFRKDSDRQVLVVGVGDKIGIWEPVAFAEYEAKAESYYRETAPLHL